MMITTPYLPEAHERVQRDLIEAEREQRRTAEALARELVKVLQELALLLDGERLESLRREDPRCPQYWAPEDWRTFFAKIPGSKATSSWDRGDQPRLAELERTIADLRQQLATLKASSSRPMVVAEPVRQPGMKAMNEPLVPKASTGPTNTPAFVPFVVPDGMIAPLSGLLARAKEMWPVLPVTCPAAFHSCLTGKGRIDEDLKKAYRRYWLSLYLIGTLRLNGTLEINDLLAMTGGLSCQAGSLRRIIDELVEAGILIGKVLRLSSPRTSLRVVKLTEKGRQLFKILFDHEPLETDWERLVRDPSDDPFEERIPATLLFAIHARKRGWATDVLPKLRVVRGSENWNVEIVTEPDPHGPPSERTKIPRWKEGPVALCAAEPIRRERLSEACWRAGLSGCSTDLETLIRARYAAINAETPLWAENWSAGA